MGISQANELNFDQLTIKDGLAHNSVLSLLEDQYGYIWIGTQNGLNKYDGVDFSLYKSQTDKTQADYFEGKHIVSLFEDKQRNLWVGTANNGVNVKWNDKDGFENISLDTLVGVASGAEITSINEDDNSNIWITTLGKGVLKYQPNLKKITQYTQKNSGLSNDYAFDMELVKGQVWIATAGRGLNVLQDDKFSLVFDDMPNSPAMDGFRKKLLLNGDLLYVASEGTGLYEINLQTEQSKHYSNDTEARQLSSHLVRDVLIDRNGNLLVATDGGGLNVIKKDGEIHKYTNSGDLDNSLNSNALLCLLKDSNETIWIGSFNGGVNLVLPNGKWFRHIKPLKKSKKPIVYPSVLAMVDTKEGLLIGTDGGGLNKLLTENYPQVFDEYKLDSNNKLFGKVIKSFFEDRQGNLWIGTYGTGLAKYNFKSKKLEQFVHDPNYPSGIGGNNIWGIAQLKNNDIWVATIGEGLSVLPYGTESFIRYKHDPNDSKSLIDDRVSCMLVDSKDNVWLGTKHAGLDRWDENLSEFIHHQYDEHDKHSLSNNEITCIFEDSQGEIWIGTEGGGLNKYLGDGKFKRLTTDDGLYSNDVLGIIEDDKGLLWFSDFSGISRYNPKRNSFKHFSINEGEFGTQFNPLSLMKSKDGLLYFGGIDGLYGVNPAQIKEDSVSSNLTFTSFSIFNEIARQGIKYNKKIALDKPIELEDHIYLDYTQNSFSIEFASLSPSINTSQEFNYRLEGFDKEWVNKLAAKGKVSYTNLDHGNYTFVVKNRLEEKRLAITIDAPFWRKTWFKIVLGWLFLISVVLLYAYSNQIKEERHKKELSEAESKILQLENKNLQVELESQNSKLLFSTAQMAHKNEILSAMKEELKSKQKDLGINLSSIVRGLDRELQSEDYWKEFNVYFNQVDGDFVNKIKAKHPGLTKNDVRLSALIRIGLSTNEIASILNISTRGVEKGRYRLKKRIGLESSENLIDYVVQFNS